MLCDSGIGTDSSGIGIGYLFQEYEFESMFWLESESVNFRIEMWFRFLQLTIKISIRDTHLQGKHKKGTECPILTLEQSIWEQISSDFQICYQICFISSFNDSIKKCITFVKICTFVSWKKLPNYHFWTLAIKLEGNMIQIFKFLLMISNFCRYFITFVDHFLWNNSPDNNY